MRPWRLSRDAVFRAPLGLRVPGKQLMVMERDGPDIGVVVGVLLSEASRK
jgi:hypothetical protein